MSTTSSKPNVIWIFGDQHRAQSLGCYGDPNLHTPNIDRLAAEGVRFTAAVSGSPLCCPYRGSLLTSRYPHHCVPGHERRMPPGQPTIAKAFKEAGYHTAYFGKWHLDGHEQKISRAAMHIIPPERRGGFDHWVGYENNNRQYDCWVHGGEGEKAFHYKLPTYETDALTDLLIAHLKDQSNQTSPKPFFAALSVQPPHNPYVAPEEWLQRHSPDKVKLRPNVPNVPRILERCRKELAGYHAMIENLDWNLGRMQQALNELGLAENTHIIFFSDHGDMHGSHGQFLKTSPWEESIRVPFIVGGGPKGLKTGLCDAPINHVDIAPTTLGLCGVSRPEWMGGTDYSHYRLEKPNPDSEPDSAYMGIVIPTGHGDSVDRSCVMDGNIHASRAIPG
jgi:arylsulfatase A-like enzyme